MSQHLPSRRRTHPLSGKEQLRLVTEYRHLKDPRIERKLVETNLRLVAKIAHQLDRTRGLARAIRDELDARPVAAAA